MISVLGNNYYVLSNSGIALMPASQMYFHQGHQIASRKLTVEKKASTKAKPTSPIIDSDNDKKDDKKDAKKDAKKTAKEKKPSSEPEATAAASSETPAAADAPKKKKKRSKFELI